MRYVKYFFLGVILLILVTVAFANRETVTLTILPQALEPFIGLNAIVGPIVLPLYMVVFGGVAVGLILGFIWEWIRESKHRREASQQRRSKAQAETEVKKLKARQNAGRDEVLVMVEETAPAR